MSRSYLTAEELSNCHTPCNIIPNIFTPCDTVALVNRAIGRHLAILRTRAAGMVGRCDEVSSPLLTNAVGSRCPHPHHHGASPYTSREIMQAIAKEQIRFFTMSDPGRVAGRLGPWGAPEDQEWQGWPAG